MSSAVWLVVVVLAACGGRYPGSTPPPAHDDDETDDTEQATTEPPPARRKPAPEPPPASPPRSQYDDPKIAALIEQLDPTEYARWPLTHNQHPALEPSYAIANAFAQPGVSWLDLCRLGAQNRRGAGSPDQLEYLRAWCSVASRDPRAAVSRLAPLVHASVLGMPAAVRTDLANIVVDTGTADEALRLLAAARVDDLAIYDLVAASFIEVGRAPDALVFAERALAVNDQRRPVDHCMRLTRRAVLVDPAARMAAVQALSPFEGIPTCATLLHELKCWHAKACDQFLLEHGIAADVLELGQVYLAWPAPTATAEAWLAIAQRASLVSARGADEAVTSALEAALRSAHCEGAQLGAIRNTARILKQQRHDPNLDVRLDLIDVTPDSICMTR
ncbi:MAG: hypothetical protein IPQ07_30560 [Myxococcales bacterium]|nr:hypothetical protein [Myxococcales bacterium]